MNLLKLGLIFAAVTLFIVACNNQTANNTANTGLVNNSTTIANSTPAAQPTTAATDELAAARGIFKETCAGCHRENGEGGQAEYEGKKIKVPSYKSKGAMAASDEKLADYIRNGEENEMPAFKDKLKPEEIESLVKLIRKDFQGK